MSPLPIPPVPASIQTWPALVDRQHLFRFILLFSAFVVAIRSGYLIVAYKKRRTSHSNMSREDSSVDHKKTLKRRNDSSHDAELHVATDVNQGKKLAAKRGGDIESPRSSPDKEPKQYLQSLKQEILQPFLRPIYPWTSPPKPLPGPYDTPYYPLPLPTIKLEKSIDITIKSPTVKLEQTSDNMPEELESISYTRRVPATSTPDRESLIEGFTTVSTKGWKRTQWTVTAG
jgi:hypothetical protein